MGWTYTVDVWECAVGSDRYYWLQVYGGQNMLKAIYYTWWARRQGWKCIKFEWRL